MKDIAQVWVFSSDSSNKKYETILYTDRTSSCNCPGWKFKARSAGGERTCKHTRMVELGMADSQCVSTKRYSSTTVAVNVATSSSDVCVTVDASVKKRRFTRIE